MLGLVELFRNEIKRRIADRLQKLSWSSLILLFILVIMIGRVIQDPEIVFEYWDASGRLYRIMVNYGSENFPLSNEQRASLQTIRDGLNNGLINAYRPTGNILDDPWTTSQVLLAINFKNQSKNINPANGIDFIFDQNKRNHEGMWKAFDDSTTDLRASSWCLFLLAKNKKVPLERLDGAIDYLLGEQHTDGSWGIYSGLTKDALNSSTYATCWALLALSEWSKSAFLAEKSERIEDAKNRGVDWLEKNREWGRWKDYRGRPEGIVSLSISGLAIHTLKMLDPNSHDFQRQAADWLGKLPEDMPLSPFYKEVSGLPLKTEDGTGDGVVTGPRDATRNYVIPWIIIGTVDAYKLGGLSEKYKAVIWMDRLFLYMEKKENRVDAQVFPWVAAELLIALDHLDHAAEQGSPDLFSNFSSGVPASRGEISGRSTP